MATKISVTIDENGQLILPMEVKEQLNLKNNDWLKVSIKSDHIVLLPPAAGLDEEIDEELLKVLVHEGILIDVDK